MPFDGTQGIPASSAASTPRPTRSAFWARREFWQKNFNFMPQPSVPRQPRYVQVLRAAQALLADSLYWTQGAYVERKHGHVRRCAVGALRRACDDLGASIVTYNTAYACLVQAARREFPEKVYGVNMVERVNDRASHAEVMRMFDSAISGQPPSWLSAFRWPSFYRGEPVYH